METEAIRVYHGIPEYDALGASVGSRQPLCRVIIEPLLVPHVLSQDVKRLTALLNCRFEDAGPAFGRAEKVRYR